MSLVHAPVLTLNGVRITTGGVDPAGEGSQPSDGTTGSTVSTVHPAAANSRRPSVG